MRCGRRYSGESASVCLLLQLMPEVGHGRGAEAEWVVLTRVGRERMDNEPLSLLYPSRPSPPLSCCHGSHLTTQHLSILSHAGAAISCYHTMKPSSSMLRVPPRCHLHIVSAAHSPSTAHIQPSIPYTASPHPPLTPHHHVHHSVSGNYRHLPITHRRRLRPLSPLHPLPLLPPDPLLRQRPHPRRFPLRSPRRFGGRQVHSSQLPRSPRGDRRPQRPCARRRARGERIILRPSLRVRAAAERATAGADPA